MLIRFFLPLIFLFLFSCSRNPQNSSNANVRLAEKTLAHARGEVRKINKKQWDQLAVYKEGYYIQTAKANSIHVFEKVNTEINSSTITHSFNFDNQVHFIAFYYKIMGNVFEYQGFMVMGW